MKQKNNILYIESGPLGGGSFHSLYQHLRIINKDYFNPVVVCLNNNSNIEPLKSLGISVYLLRDWLYDDRITSYKELILHKITETVEHCMSIFYITFFRITHKPLLLSLERIIHKENINLIHLNVQIKRDLFGLIAAERTNIPCISHLRSMRSGVFGKYQAGFANRHVSTFIANSNCTKQHWKERGIKDEKIRVVYNAIDHEQIKPEDVRKKWAIDTSVRFIIGCFSNFINDKGHNFLLQAFAGLLKFRSHSVLLLAGHGPLKEELLRKTIALGISQQVIFTGYLTNAVDIIAGCDLLVLPSQNEPFGRVLLEAMMAGTAVVAADTGGIPEVIKHEYNGLLVNYGDEEGLQKAIEKVLIDKDLRSRLVANGHKTLENFSIEQYDTELVKIYKEVINTYRKLQ